MESSKLLGSKRANLDGVQNENVTVKVKASSTVRDAKPSYHKESIKANKLSALSSSTSSASPSSSSSSSSPSTSTSHLASSTTRSSATKVYHVKDEALPSTASCSSLSTSSGSSSASSSTDQSFTAADSNSNLASKSFSPCKVCGDKASGYHYGVTSCEGCKGFFRRSIQKQIEYRCLRDGKCTVIRLNRNRCQYCRFMKCTSVGMSRDSVRYGRVPKRAKGREDEATVTQSEADQSMTKETDNSHMVLYDIILSVSNAHLASCSYTEEKIRGLVKKPAIFNLSYAHGNLENTEETVVSLEQQKLSMWEHFAEYVTPSVQRIVEFAKRSPGFTELIQDDQLVLIKIGFFEIWLVHVSRMIEPVENTLTFCDGSYISKQQLELVFDQDFVTSMFTFGVTFNNLGLSDHELGIFSAMVLLAPDRHGITDSSFIQQQHDKLGEALKFQIARTHNGDLHLYSNALRKLVELRNLGSQHSEHLKWFRMHWERIKLPPLFAEIFDIPKCEPEKL